MATQHITDELNFEMIVNYKDKNKPPKKLKVYNFNVDTSGGLTYFLGHKEDVREINFICADSIRSVRGTRLTRADPSNIITPKERAIVS